ncbi:MAG: pilus assembly protein PilM [Lachnospiraceae bacterium]|nr:pilus assembly protein PilM [Lachnospiraceae bacterium]
MAKTVVSIEIGLTQTRMLEIDMGKKIQHVKKAVIIDTPENTIEDGYIRETSELAERMSMQMQAAGIKTKDIIFTVSSNKVISREVTVTAIKEKMIENIVKAEASDYFPMDISDHVISHSIIGQNDTEKQYRLMVYAVPDTLLQCYYNLADEMRCNIVAMDFVGNSMYQWLKRSTLQDVSLVMQINETSTVVTVVDKGELGVQRTISYGSCTLADALMETHCYDEATTQAAALKLLQEEEFLSISEEEEERWKKRELARICENRFRRIENQQNAGDDEAAAANDLSVERILSDDEILKRRINARAEVSEAARTITGKVQRVMEYYTTNHPESSIERIYITGPGTAVKGIEAMLAAELDLPVEIYNVTEGVVFAATAAEFEERGAEFFACFGATVSPLGMRPAEAILREQKRNISILTGTVFIATAAVIAILVVTTLIQINYEKDVKAKLEVLIDEADDILQLTDVHAASQQSIQQMQGVDDMTFSEGEQLNELIASLEEEMPTRSRVHSFSLAGSVLTMNVTTVTKEEAAKVLLQLQEVPYIAIVSTSGIAETVDETTNRTEVAFSVNCILQKYVPVEEGTEAGDTAVEGTEVQ